MFQKKINIDDNWKFYQAHSEAQDPDFGFMKCGESTGLIKENYDDSSWRTVHLPHDFVAELPYDLNSPIYQGYKQTFCGENRNYVAWYRKKIIISKELSEERLFLEFDGCFRDTCAWINGYYLGNNLGGYVPFSFSVSDFVKYDEPNIITVRVNISQSEGWFYEGGGIYRHVYLASYPSMYLNKQALFIRSTVEDKLAKITAECEISGSDNQDPISAVIQISDSNGKSVLTENIENIRNGKICFDGEFKDFTLWDTENPYLYSLTITIYSSGKPIDSISEKFGIRFFRFDAEKGFFLNGRHLKIQGVCCHQDFAGVGSALTDNLHIHKIKLLKEMGCNAYRTAHHAPAKEILDACDKYGLLVLDETRCASSSDVMLEQLKSLICRDRNHPSIIIWGIGNEEHTVQNTEIGERIGRRMTKLIRQLDSTRPITYAGNNGNNYDGLNKIVDIRGWNYRKIGEPDEYHKEHPKQPIIATEEGSTFGTRGEYKDNIAKSKIGCFDAYVPNWGDTAEGFIRYYADRPFLAGYFVWTGFDYRGEPSPTQEYGTSSQFGIMDTCGFKKDIYYFYKSWWGNESVLHLFVCDINSSKKAIVYSNYKSVELLCDGVSYGNKVVENYSHAEWDIPIESKELIARVLDDGKYVTVEKKLTNRKPAKIFASYEHDSAYSSKDTAMVTVEIQDEYGELCDTDLSLQIETKGAYLTAFGNGDPANIEPEQNIFPSRHAIISGEYGIYSTSDGSEFKPQNIERVNFKPILFHNDIPLPLLRCYENGTLSSVKGIGVRATCELLIPVHLRTMLQYVYRIPLKLSSEMWDQGYRAVRFEGLLGKESKIYCDGSLLSTTTFDVRNYAVQIPKPSPSAELIVVCSPFYDGLSAREQMCGIIGSIYIENVNATVYSHRVFHGKGLLLLRADNTEQPVSCRISADGLAHTDIIIGGEKNEHKRNVFKVF